MISLRKTPNHHVATEFVMTPTKLPTSPNNNRGKKLRALNLNGFETVKNSLNLKISTPIYSTATPRLNTSENLPPIQNYKRSTTKRFINKLEFTDE